MPKRDNFRDLQSHLYFRWICIIFNGLKAGGAFGAALDSTVPAERDCMGFQYFAGAAYRALTARKDGPSLYDVCDPLLLNYAGGDPHLGKFYRTALGNPALRPLLRRTGLPQLRDERRLEALRAALIRARDEARAGLGSGRPAHCRTDGDDRCPASQPGAGERPRQRRPISARSTTSSAPAARICCGSFARNGFIPTYAAFNLLGDADMGGREMLMALSGLNSRGYKNSTLLFSLARIFIAHSPARALINPPWRGIAEPMWEPMQIRHRSAYYDAFFTEALLSFVETGLASADQTVASRRAISDMVDFCLTTSAEEVPSHDASTVRVITALAPLPHPRFSKFFFPDQAGSRLRHLCAGLRHHRLLVLGRNASRLHRSDPRPAATGFLRRLSGRAAAPTNRA